MQISVSIEPYLGVDISRLTQYIENILQLNRCMKAATGDEIAIHFDYFKANPAVFRLVQSYTNQIAIDLHLMQVSAPSVDGFRSVCYDVNVLETGMTMMAAPTQRGLVLDLGTMATGHETLLRTVQYIILMTVKCGKSGQTFQSEPLSLIPQIRNLNPNAVIIVDGGVNENNVSLLKKAGVDVVVVGSYAQKCYENGNLQNGINRLLHD